jgi:site-specific recombinase XerD
VASPTLLQSFDGYLRRRGRAASTRRQYAYSLGSFAGWLGTSAVGDLTPADLELFLIQWEAEFRTRHGHEPSPSTLRGTIGALRVFFAYLEQAELLVGADGSLRRNPTRAIDAPACPQRPNDFLRPHAALGARSLGGSGRGHQARPSRTYVPMTSLVSSLTLSE